LRDAALRNQPWQFSTGPRSPEGKAKAAMNGHQRRADPQSSRQLRAGLTGFAGLVNQISQLRQVIQRERESGSRA
jgi:hypothetical protein